jgi:hypothetical protein
MIDGTKQTEMHLFPIVLAFDFLILLEWLSGHQYLLFQSQVQSLLICCILGGSRRVEKIWENVPLAFQITFGHFIIIWSVHLLVVVFSREYWKVCTVKTPSRWLQLWKILFDIRWVNTSKPAASSREYLDSFYFKDCYQSVFYAPSSHRVRFILRRSLGVICTLTLYIAYRDLTSRAMFRHDDFTLTKGIFLRRLFADSISNREVIIRCWLVGGALFSNYAIVSILHGVLSITAVSLHFDEPEDWPSMYGSLADAYSLGRFWSRFWNRWAYKIHCTFAKHLAFKVLEISRGTFVATASIHVLVFLFSGMIHGLVSWELGYGCGVWEEIAWYCFNSIITIIELNVSTILAILEKRGGLYLHPPLCRVFGYFWTFGILFWSLPKVQFAYLSCPRQ